MFATRSQSELFSVFSELVVIAGFRICVVARPDLLVIVAAVTTAATVTTSTTTTKTALPSQL